MNRLRTAFLGIGTNKGEREKNIAQTLELLATNPKIKILKVSKMLKNPPQEGIKSGYFLNGAIKLLTSLSPYELLRLCKKIERKMGREDEGARGREGERERGREKRSRVIDLDILFYEDKITNTNKLTIPHPMLYKRYFVLIPLMEIEKDFVHPVFQKPIKELYDEFNNHNPTSIKYCARAV